VVSDPRKLRPSELCRMLNSTPLGEVISERQLYRHRTRAGMRIGDARYVDLLRYGAWLVETRHAPAPETSGDPYEKLKERARARNVAIATAGRDIGELPEIADPERKAKAATNFRYFCESYFPLTFHLAWSDDHLKVINRIEQAVLRGGLFSMAMPRGSGKDLHGYGGSRHEALRIWPRAFRRLGTHRPSGSVPRSIQDVCHARGCCQPYRLAE